MVTALEKQPNSGKPGCFRLLQSSPWVWAQGQDMGSCIRTGLYPREAVEHPRGREESNGLLTLKGGGVGRKLPTASK